MVGTHGPPTWEGSGKVAGLSLIEGHVLSMWVRQRSLQRGACTHLLWPKGCSALSLGLSIDKNEGAILGKSEFLGRRIIQSLNKFSTATQVTAWEFMV